MSQISQRITHTNPEKPRHFPQELSANILDYTTYLHQLRRSTHEFGVVFHGEFNGELYLPIRTLIWKLKFPKKGLF